MSSSALWVRGARASYARRPVLRGVDLDVAAGEVVGLIGPNGCGKTTLLKAVTKLVPLQAGEVQIGGAAIEVLSPREMAQRVAVVPQGARLPAGYTVREVVLMGRTAHLGFLQQEGAKDLAKVEEALALVGAMPLADRQVDELSGGERQNAVIARALVQEAPLLLLDEPTANLDLGHQVAVATLMRRLAQERGLAVLAAVHDLMLAALYCDRLVLMRDGVVIASGLPSEVLTREYVTAAYGIDAAIVPVEGVPAPVVLPLERDS
jgi:iron complex transport system ATP-binding protein